MIKKFITIKFQIPGIHRWKHCPFGDVSFLKEWHRHIFHFELKLQVEDSDRELEFIREKRIIKKEAEKILNSPLEESCESIGEILLSFLISEYGEEMEYSIHILEDNENGGLIVYIPD